MGLDRRRARRAVERRVSDPQAPGAADLGRLLGEPQNIADTPAYYGRGDDYGDGDKYQPPGIGTYGASRYDTGATYGEAATSPTTGVYGRGWYERNAVYGE